MLKTRMSFARRRALAYALAMVWALGVSCGGGGDAEGDAENGGAPSCDETCSDVESRCPELSTEQCMSGCQQANWDECQRDCVASASNCAELDDCQSVCSGDGEPDGGSQSSPDASSGTDVDAGVNPQRNCPGVFQNEEDACPGDCPEETGIIDTEKNARYCAPSPDDAGNCTASGLELYQGACRHTCESSTDCPQDRYYDYDCYNPAGGSQDFCFPSL